jgi:hypothetical protein
MEYIEREDWFETTPERFGEWLYRETFQRWPDESPVSEFIPYPPETFRVEHGIALGVELTASDSEEPVTVHNAIRFWMLQTSDYPNVTHIRSKCMTGTLPFDRDAVIDCQNAVTCFEMLWKKMYSQFRRADVFGVGKTRGAPNEIYHTGIEQDEQSLRHVLSEIQRVGEEQAAVARTVDSLRRWAQVVQQSGLPPDKNLQASIESLAQNVEHSGGITQYLEVNLPLIPGILNYKIEVGSEHNIRIAELAKLWEELKNVKANVALNSAPSV